MIPEFSVSVSPIVPWPLLIGVIGMVTVLTLWAYRRKLHGTSGAWRWFALSLRLLAILLCLLAALRPSVALEGEGAAEGRAGLPGGPQHQHDLRRRGRRQDPLGRRRRDAGAGPRRGQEARARPRAQVLRLRFQGRGAQGRRPDRQGRAQGARLGRGDRIAGRPEPPGAGRPQDRPDHHDLGFLVELRHRPDGGRAADEGQGRAGHHRRTRDRDRRLRRQGRHAAGDRRRPDGLREEQPGGQGDARRPRLRQPDARRRALRRGQPDRRGPHQDQGPRRQQRHPDQRAQVHPADRRREADHAQGRRPGRRDAQVEQRDQHVRHGPLRRAQRAVPPGLELLLGLQVPDAIDRDLAGHPRRGRDHQGRGAGQPGRLERR